VRLRTLLTIERIKAFHHVGFWSLLTLFAGLVFLVASSSLYSQLARGAEAFRLPDVWPEIVNATRFFALFPVIATVVLLSGSEWSWRTARQNVIDGLSRDEFFAAKAVLVLLVAAFYWAVGVLVAGGAAAVGTAAAPSGASLVGAADVQMLGGLFLALALAGAAALLMAAVTSGAGAALALAIVFLGGQMLAALFFRARGGSWAVAAAYLPTSVMGALAEPFTYHRALFDALEREGTPGAAMLGTAAGGPAAVLLWGALYLAAFLACAWLAIRRRPL
jgi:ABC-2 type transport system permease protein